MTPSSGASQPGPIDLTDSERAELEDPALARAVAQRYAQALAEVYERHGGAVRGLASHLCGTDHADDVVQEVFLRFWQRPGEFDPTRGSLRSYLLMTAHSRAVSVLRTDTARRGREARSSSAATQKPAGDPADAIGEPALGMLSQLPASQREAISLAYFVGYSYREVAQVLGQSEGTIKARIRAGLRRLRRLMAIE